MSAATTQSVQDGRQRAVVLFISLLAIGIDGAAEPATGGIIPAAARALSADDMATLLAKVGFSVAYALGVLASLWLIKNHGKRGYFRGSLFGYATACLVAALSPDVTLFVAARIFQGAFLGGLFASALLTMVAISPPSRLALVFAFFTAVALAAPELAPLISSVVNALGGWRLVFAALAVLPAIGGVIASTSMKDPQGPTPSQFDTGSFIAAALFLAALYSTLEQAQGLSADMNLGLAAAIATVALAWFILRETRLAGSPFVDLRPFKLRIAGQGLTACVLLGIVLGSSASLVTFLMRVLHVAPFVAVSTSASAFFGAAAGTLVVYQIGVKRITDNRTSATIGIIGLALLFALFAASANNGIIALPIYISLSVLQGFALAMTIGPLAGLLFASVPKDQFGALALLFKIALGIGAAIAIPLAAHVVASKTLWFTLAVICAVMAVLVAALPRLSEET